MSQSVLEGGCLCGALRYRVEGEALVSGICHCRTCRRTASAPMLPFLTFSAERFVLTQGTVADFHSSSGVTRSFCGRCGSPLTYRNEREPEQIDVMTCSLDDPEAFPPTYHVWVSHKLKWERLTDGLSAYHTTRSAGYDNP
jgi:hypothetical protein